MDAGRGMSIDCCFFGTLHRQSFFFSLFYLLVLHVFLRILRFLPCSIYCAPELACI